MRKFFANVAGIVMGMAIITAFAISGGVDSQDNSRTIYGIKSESADIAVEPAQKSGDGNRNENNNLVTNDSEKNKTGYNNITAGESKETDSTENVTGVYACGRLTGIYEQTEGVLVVDTAEVEDENGKKSTPGKGKVKSGDYIIAIDDRSISDKEELTDTVNEIMHDKESKNYITIKLLRNNKEKTVKITPVKAKDDKYYMGIWVKDDLAGIGTITYYTKDGRFGALGHGIGDGTDSGNLLSVNSGDLYSMRLTNIQKGKSGEPGELGGVVYFGRKSHIGTLDSNSELGIYGQLDEEELDDYSAEDNYYPVAAKNEIKTGAAQIISEVSGKIEKYNIEITNVDYFARDTNKGLVIKVTDEKLIGLTGGIVQGTSGSPIIQNGKIIGAVTHVFVDDPTRGYGICIDEMLD